MATDWGKRYRDRLPGHLDAAGDLAPPWERFPTYERYTIGWRMGTGEDWMMYWHVFADGLAPDSDTRLAYLRRHPPAPVTWADFVFRFLHPGGPDLDDENDDNAVGDDWRAELRQLGVIAPDVAYRTWLSQQADVRWPWTFMGTPAEAVRYRARDLDFWSRQVVEQRCDPAWTPPPVPHSWQPCAEPLRTGEVRSPDVDRGLLTLAQMLSAGRVLPPWTLGLTVADFADSFADDVGYVDAFRLWVMSAFDDREQEQVYLAAHAAPPDWRAWFADQFRLR